MRPAARAVRSVTRSWAQPICSVSSPHTCPAHVEMLSDLKLAPRIGRAKGYRAGMGRSQEAPGRRSVGAGDGSGARARVQQSTGRETRESTEQCDSTESVRSRSETEREAKRE